MSQLLITDFRAAPIIGRVKYNFRCARCGRPTSTTILEKAQRCGPCGQCEGERL